MSATVSVSVSVSVCATVHVVDDDAGVRESTRMLFESLGLPVRTFASAREFLSAYTPEMRGCVLTDLRMPDMDGLALQEQLARRHSPLPVVFLTGHGDISSALVALKRGAADFLLKPAREQDLLDAVNRALRRESAGHDRFRTAESLRTRLATLTAREHEVVEHVLAGRPTRVVATALGITDRTVEAHRARAFAKLGVRSVPELVRALDTLR